MGQQFEHDFYCGSDTIVATTRDDNRIEKRRTNRKMNSNPSSFVCLRKKNNHKIIEIIE